MIPGISLLSPFLVFLADEIRLLLRSRLHGLNHIGAAVLFPAHPDLPPYQAVFRADRKAIAGSLPQREPAHLFSQHPVAHRAYHVRHHFILQGFFPVREYNGHIFGVIGES